MSVTPIEWTERSWNPVVGCSVLTPGCTNCYAMKMAARIERMGTAPHYNGTTKDSKAGAVWTGKLALAPAKILYEPMHRKKPTTYFVNSMGDLFHEDCPTKWIDDVFAIMALSPKHTFQVLTKRSGRMREYLLNKEQTARSALVNFKLQDTPQNIAKVLNVPAWPLPNVWLGVSTERQPEADARIPDLLATPAAIHFISAEPLLGPLDLYNGDPDPRLGGHQATKTFIGNWWERGDDPKAPSRHGLDWVIVGGESGPNARPMHPNWVRSLRDQCDAAEVKFFFKQWGEFTPGENVERTRGSVVTADWFNDKWLFGTENLANCEGHVDDEPDLYRVGKKAAGRALDGKHHDGMPERLL